MYSDNLIIPRSVGIIMDGNGRWAAERGLPRTLGHKAGCDAIEKLIPEADDIGIEFLTVYAFSTENWKRSEDEINGLFGLFRIYAGRLLKAALKNNVRIRMIGDRSRFPQDIIDETGRLEQETKDNTGLTFTVAANYGGRDEIRRAAMAFAKDYKSGTVPCGVLGSAPDGGLCEEKELTEKGFSSYFDTAGIPDPDLIIRTSGELRISNFLIWQAAYAEIVVEDCYWPDFGREELLKAIGEFNKRTRRFGGA